MLLTVPNQKHLLRGFHAHGGASVGLPVLGRATAISAGAGQNCIFWDIFRMCSRNLDAVGELHHSLPPSLGGLEPVLVREPREVRALLWVSGRSVAGFGVQMCPLP